MSTPNTTPRPLFSPDDFDFLRKGSGAAKLAESAVAPLVAAARGYETVFPAEVKQAAQRHRLGSLTSAAGRKLKDNVGDDDVMLMPWHRLDETLSASAKGTIAKRTSLQMRPSEPLPPTKPGGKSRKYDTFTGTSTEIDLHPSIPADWNTTAPTVLFTEGLIKGDAALTGMLRAAGISDEELAKTHPGGDPAAELRKLMEQVPAEDRVLIASFIGVANWRGRPEWAVLSLRDKDAWVVFDADAGENFQVWKQAAQLLAFLEGRKMNSVRLADLGKVHPEAGQRKLGIDDYLAQLGRWEDLPASLGDLPPRPPRKDEAREGEWRVTEDGMGTQAAVKVTPGGGGDPYINWIDQTPIGGRVSRVESRRQPTRVETETGTINLHEEDLDPMVELELAWEDPLDGTPRSGRVTGPAAILNYGPKDWDRKGANMPSNLLRHPEWPPDKGLDWLKAIKAHRAEETTESVRWKSMGYVPTSEGQDSSLPAYIVGETVVTEHGIGKDPSIVGVDDEVLAGSSNFGVIAPDEDADWREQALADLEAVLDTYIDSGAWTSPAMAATVLGIGLRPAIPIRPTTVAYFVGARRSGKSFTASHCMSFWQPRPGTWNENFLPGSAKDTIASMEHAVAHSNIWVSDDLAPSTDRNQASREEAAMGALIRSIFNGTAKRRMNPDGTSREVLNPRALLIVTAENEPSVSSVGDRMVVLNFGEGALAADRAVTERLVRMRNSTGEPARLAGAFIRWHLWRASQMPGGWAQMYQEVEKELDACTNLASRLLSGRGRDGDASRHAGIAGDVMLTLVRLGQMAEDLGAPASTIERLMLGGLPRDVVDQVARAHEAQKGTSPGRRALQAASLLLRGKRAHVVSLDDPTMPPVKDRPGADLANASLGWTKSGGEWRPQGPTVGWLVKARDRATDVVLLDPELAFTHAQAHFPHLLPAGQKQTTAWASAWDEKLTVPPRTPDGKLLGWNRNSNSRNALSYVRVHTDGQVSSGVPFLLDTILNGVTDGPEQDDDQDHDQDQNSGEKGGGKPKKKKGRKSGPMKAVK